MYNKIFRTLTLSIFALFVCFQFFQKETKVETTNDNMQTVIFKDQYNDLIPISVNMPNSGEAETNYRAILEVMKSHDYEKLGLYPILQDDFEVNTLILESNQLTFDCTNAFKNINNEGALDICEALSYLFCHDNIERINMSIEGKPVSSFENTTIPLSCMTKDLGINNFNTSSSSIHLTTPVTIYNEKEICGNTYIIPTTTRIATVEGNINEQLLLLLDHFVSPAPIELENEAYLEDGHLDVYLTSSILQSSETIASSLYERLKHSFLSLPQVDDVSIYIDHQIIDTPVSNTIANEIRL